MLRNIRGLLSFTFISGGYFLAYTLLGFFNLVSQEYLQFQGIINIIYGGSLIAAPTYLQLYNSKNKISDFKVPSKFILIFFILSFIYGIYFILIDKINYFQLFIIIIYIVTSACFTTLLFQLIIDKPLKYLLLFGLYNFIIEFFCHLFIIILKLDFEFIYLILSLLKVIIFPFIISNKKNNHIKIKNLLKFGFILSVNSFFITYLITNDRLILDFFSEGDKIIYLQNYSLILFGHSIVSAINMHWNPISFKGYSKNMTLSYTYKNNIINYIPILFLLSLIVWLFMKEITLFYGLKGFIYFLLLFFMTHVRHVFQSKIIYYEKTLFLIYNSIICFVILFYFNSTYYNFYINYLVPILLICIFTIFLSNKIEYKIEKK